ncbi:type II toxin-antitoxin system VapC family toxin [Methylobacterium sp. Gmos1]
MIAVDTSALLAIAFGEPEAKSFLDTLVQSDWVLGAPTALEAHIVIVRRGSASAIQALRELMTLPRLSLLPFTPAHAFIARQAFDRYGKGMGHPASLNFGDCLCYAIAKRDDLPLLYKGNDFSRTDLVPAVSVRP